MTAGWGWASPEERARARRFIRAGRSLSVIELRNYLAHAIAWAAVQGLHPSPAEVYGYAVLTRLMQVRDVEAVTA